MLVCVTDKPNSCNLSLIHRSFIAKVFVFKIRLADSSVLYRTSCYEPCRTTLVENKQFQLFRASIDAS